MYRGHKEKECMKGVPRLGVSGAYIRFSRLGGLWKLLRYPRKLGYQASWNGAYIGLLLSFTCHECNILPFVSFFVPRLLF